MVENFSDPRVPWLGFVRLVKFFRRESKVQFTGRNNFQSVVIKGNRYCSRGATVVAMRKSICQGLSNGLQRQGGSVRTSQLTGHNLAGNGQPVEQEPLCASQEAECVAAVLAIVQEFFARFAFEPGESKLELGKCWQCLVVFAKESRRCATDLIVLNQESETSEQGKRISRAWIYKAATANRLLNGDTQFIQIEILNLATICCLDFPAIAGVHGFKKMALIVASGHNTSGIEHTLVRHSSECNRRVGRALDSD